MRVRQFVPEYATPRAEAALGWFAPAQVALNPDCGFGCFASRCVNDHEPALAKLGAMTMAARELRQRHGG